MSKYVLAFILLACCVGLGEFFSCHTCASDDYDCRYGSTGKGDLVRCENGEDRCFRAIIGDQYRRGCAFSDFCNTHRDAESCTICSGDRCNSGSIH
ncbi:hypothetical protein WA026_020924 [Henosepilachna vigintioctopunctata]|uniref:DUF753 domain-containing protein n=1 Tax=Henosepilachna vigintioctopunctata TaxID=420089 RepID=A0AAW1UFN5_9CUCU